MYIISFATQADRDAHWKSLNALPEYAHNFFRANIYLLHPTAYSDI